VSLLPATGGDPVVVLDVSTLVAHEHEEQGLLSIALDPGFAENGHLWTYAIEPAPLRSVVTRYTANVDGTFDPATRLVVLEVAQPYANHNGGALRFGPDGMLYLGLGDGGDAWDPHRNGQDLAGLLGGIIRIDVRNSSPEAPYAIPADNPFVDRDGAAPETWAYGLRNPWRFSFDPETGDLWAGDVGQDTFEEVNRITAGANYGWSIVEGRVCLQQGCSAEGTVPPVAGYSHEDGCAITGGVIYRGSAIPSLSGRYLFGDLCLGSVWSLDAEGGMAEVLTVPGPLVSFATGADGEVYLLQFGAPISKIVAG
jgi:glucose/arabinose dehydrogenase